ncbi:MAG TPA: hypothetical protein DCW96_01910 [Stenotrophomonas sp.]|nr:hypothetical protein [Stenotrophomonas sp.]
MRKRRFVNILAMVGGVALAIYGVLILTIAATGNVIEGRAALACGGAGLLLVAAPLLALPFSARVAKTLALLALVSFAVLAGWLAFWPQPGISPDPLVQTAVVAFAVLVAGRIHLARRRRRSDHQP